MAKTIQRLRDPKWAFAQALVAALVVGAIGGYVVGSLASPPVAAAPQAPEKHYLVDDTTVRQITLEPGRVWTYSVTSDQVFKMAYYVHVTSGPRVNAMVLSQAGYDAWLAGEPFAWSDAASAMQVFTVSREATLYPGTLYLVIVNPDSSRTVNLDANFWPYWE